MACSESFDAHGEMVANRQERHIQVAGADEPHITEEGRIAREIQAQRFGS